MKMCLWYVYVDEYLDLWGVCWDILFLEDWDIELFNFWIIYIVLYLYINFKKIILINVYSYIINRVMCLKMINNFKKKGYVVFKFCC